jgi:hypothetical protein
MAEITKTEQGRLDRKAEAQARKQAADERRSSRNEAQQRVDSNITPSTMGQREAAAGLTDTNTTSGRGLAEPTFSQREAAAGLTDTHVGRDDFYTKRGRQRPMWSPLEGGEMQAGSPMEFKADAAADGEPPPFAFKVVNDGDGAVSVTEGSVNTETATGLTPSGKPTELWLKVTFDTDGEVTAASVETSKDSTSATQDYRLIAFITWDGNSPTIIQNMGGGQSIGSCGTMHQWTAIYYPSY